MNHLNELRVPGLGLAAAIPDELMTEPRFDVHLTDDAKTTPTNHRLFKLFRPGSRGHRPALGTRSMTAASPGKDLARA